MVERVTIVTEDNSPSEADAAAHEAAMVAKVDGKAAQATETPANNGEDRPGWLPEKFKSPEDLAKAYAELESRLGKGEPPKGEDTPKPDTPTPDKPANPLEIDKATQDELSKANIDINSFADEFAQAGKLSDESYDKLAKAGFTRDVVDQFIEGRMAVAERNAQAIYSVIGGQDKYAEMVQWAAKSLSEAEIDAFNKVVGGPKEQAQLAVQGLYSRFTAANGIDPKLATGATGPQNTGYASVREYLNDVKDPRYKTDGAYRDAVIAKLSRSNIM